MAAIGQRSWVVMVMTLLLITSVVLSVSTSFWVIEPLVSLLILMAAVVLMSAPMQRLNHLMLLTALLTIHLLAAAFSATFSLSLITLLVLGLLISRLLRGEDWSLPAGLLLLCLLCLPQLFVQAQLWAAVGYICWLMLHTAGTRHPPIKHPDHPQPVPDAEAIRTQERSRIYQNIHDDVGADLLKLIYQSENEAQRNAIKDIMSRLRQAVAKTEHRQLNLVELLDEICAETHASCQAAEIRFSSTVTVAPHPVELDLPVHLQRMVRELTSNCIKHARASALQLTARTDDGRLLLSLADNGIDQQTHECAIL